MKTSSILTTKELAGYMKLNEKTVLKMAQNGEIPGVKIGSQWRFHLSAIEKHLQKDMRRAPVDELDMIFQAAQEIVPLSRLIKPELVNLALKSITRDGILFELAEMAEEAGITAGKKALYKQLIERENMLSTAVGKGVAIPHPREARPEVFKSVNVILARAENGVDFGAPDGEKVRLFFMTCAPSTVVHLKLLSKVSVLLQGEGAIEGLIGASSKDEIMRFLLELERRKILGEGSE